MDEKVFEKFRRLQAIMAAIEEYNQRKKWAEDNGFNDSYENYNIVVEELVNIANSYLR